MALVHKAKPLGGNLESTTYTKDAATQMRAIWYVKNVNEITVTASAFENSNKTLYVCGGDNADFDKPSISQQINGTVLLHITKAGTYEIDVSGYDYIALEFYDSSVGTNLCRYRGAGSVVVEGGQLVTV